MEAEVLVAVVMVISTMVGMIVTVTRPIISLNTSITQLRDSVDRLRADGENHQTALDACDKRITAVEHSMIRLKAEHCIRRDCTVSADGTPPSR